MGIFSLCFRTQYSVIVRQLIVFYTDILWSPNSLYVSFYNSISLIFFTTIISYSKLCDLFSSYICSLFLLMKIYCVGFRRVGFFQKNLRRMGCRVGKFSCKFSIIFYQNCFFLTGNQRQVLQTTGVSIMIRHSSNNVKSDRQTCLSNLPVKSACQICLSNLTVKSDCQI